MNKDTNQQRENVIDAINYAKIKIFIQKNGPNLAIAQVTIADILEISGFTIRESQYDQLWIQPPQYGRYPKLYNAIFVKDKKIYKELLSEIERAYKNEIETLGINKAIEDMEF